MDILHNNNEKIIVGSTIPDTYDGVCDMYEFHDIHGLPKGTVPVKLVELSQKNRINSLPFDDGLEYAILWSMK